MNFILFSSEISYRFPFRVEELPVIAGFIRLSQIRDASSFSSFTSYQDPFTANYLSALNAVRAVIQPSDLTSESKLITIRLYSNVLGLRQTMNNAEAFCKEAGNTLNKLVKDMGMTDVRKGVGNIDVEHVIQGLQKLNNNIAGNFAALSAVGFTASMQTALVNLQTSINNDNDLQNVNIGARAALVTANKQLFNDFYDNFVNKTATTGKLIFRVSNKSKYNDYNISALKRRIRNDQAQTEVAGTVKDAGGLPVNKAKVFFKPTDGGRTKTVYTNAAGEYIAKGLRANDYVVVASKGTLSKLLSITVASRDHLTQNIIILPVSTPTPTPTAGIIGFSAIAGGQILTVGKLANFNLFPASILTFKELLNQGAILKFYLSDTEGAQPGPDFILVNSALDVDVLFSAMMPMLKTYLLVKNDSTFNGKYNVSFV